MLQALRIRDFQLLWGAGLVSSLGSWLLVIAVPARVYQITGSVRSTGLTLAAEYLPMLLLAPMAGVIADSLDRRRTMFAADIFRAGVVTLMLTATSRGNFWIIYVALAAESAGTAVFTPTQQARIPAIVGTDQVLTGANSLNTATSGVIRVIGGPLGGIMLTFYGMKTLIVVDVASYLVSAGAMLMTSRSPRGRSAACATSSGAIRNLADGLRLLRSQQATLILLAITITFFAANAAVTAVLIPFAIRRLGGSRQAGFLLFAVGAGILLGAPITRALADRLQLRHLLAVGQVATGAAFFTFFRSSFLITALPAAMVTGLCVSLTLTSIKTTVQRSVQDAMLGRVSAVFVAGEAAATLAGAVAGPVIAQTAGLPNTGLIAGLMTLIGAVLAYAGLRSPTDRRVAPS